MNQCVPSWDVDENPLSPKLNPRSHHSKSSNSFTIHVPTLDYEVAELTWENGQLAMHGLGLPRVPSAKSLKASSSSSTKYTWEKPRAGGTLESIVDQATSHPQHHPRSAVGGGAGDELVPWWAASASMNMAAAAAAAGAAAAAAGAAAAVVPCNSAKSTGQGHCGTRVGGSSTRESCSGVPDVNLQQARPAGAAHEWSSRADHSVSNSATWGNNRDSRQVTRDTCNRELGTVGFTSTSMGSPENTTSSAKQWTGKADDHDSVCHDRPRVEAGEEKEKKKGKSSISTRRSRAAAIHNQSERKRRDKINQRMKTLQKLIPNSSKTDKASMLDEAIEYLKQLQAQVQMMSRVNMSTMMLPMAMQQQLQMSMMAAAPMGMAGMAMGMGVMDMNTLAGRAANISGMPPAVHLHPGAFMPAMTSWDATAADRLPAPISAMTDPLSAAFLAACQSQPMTMDAYSRLASMYQQFQRQPGPSSKN